MSLLKNKIVIAIFTLFAFSTSAFADGGTVTSYSPYSMFALGDLSSSGTAYNKTMGGVGIATRNNKFINIQNPAAVTARDSLAFMVDFSVNQENKIFRDGTGKSAYNIANIGDCVLSFPIWKSSAMMIGIQPYSGTGYDFSYYETNKKAVSSLGNIQYSYNGTGGVYQLFAAAGVTFFKRLSVGAQAMYYFGNIERSYKVDYETETAPDIEEITNVEVNSFSGKFGLQYEQPLGKNMKLGFGATYKLKNNFNGLLSKVVSSTYNKISIDTLSKTPGRIVMPSEMGFGVSFNYADNIRAEFNYVRSNWKNSNFDTDEFFIMTASSLPFTTAVSQTFRVGVEWIPNKNDIRYYFKKVAYRAGAFYKTDYFNVAGQNIESIGVTVGATLPIFRWYNGLSVAFELGKRGSLKGGLIKENYFNISVGVNLFDIWFQKPKYE